MQIVTRQQFLRLKRHIRKYLDRHPSFEERVHMPQRIPGATDRWGGVTEAYIIAYLEVMEDLQMRHYNN